MLNKLLKIASRLLMGFFVLLAGVILTGEVIWLKGTTKTQGEIITYQSYPDTLIAKPLVLFNVEDGQTIYFESSVGERMDRVRYKEGQKVDVFYVTETPQDAQISGFIEQWGLVVLLVALSFFIYLMSEMYFFFQDLTSGTKIFKSSNTIKAKS